MSHDTDIEDEDLTTMRLEPHEVCELASGGGVRRSAQMVQNFAWRYAIPAGRGA